MKNKNQIISFLMGAVAALVISTLSLLALAASGAFTITGSPINVLVNGFEEALHDRVVVGVTFRGKRLNHAET